MYKKVHKNCQLKTNIHFKQNYRMWSSKYVLIQLSIFMLQSSETVKEINAVEQVIENKSKSKRFIKKKLRKMKVIQ